MKLKITIIAAATFATTLHAELDTKSFSLVEAWAQKQGYSYDGIARRFDAHVFVNKAGVIVFAPVSSDSADEAINALIASRVTNAFHAETANDKPVAGALGEPKRNDKVPAAVSSNLETTKDYTGEEAAIMLAGFELNDDFSREQKDIGKKLLVAASKTAAAYSSLDGDTASYLPEIKEMAPTLVATIFPGIKPKDQQALAKTFYLMVTELLKREGFITSNE